jgi:hypothetical protein
MNSANDGNREDGDGERKVVTSLRDMPRSIAPPRDLWAGIEASIAADRRATAADSTVAEVSGGSRADTVTDLASRRSSGGTRQFTRLRWMAAAAVIAALAVGMWIGRTVLPTTRPTTIVADGNSKIAPPPKITDGATALQAAYIADPKYREQRAALVKSLEAKLASLPPDSRAKVISSLATIQKSKQDLEAALGKDPSNALLQELLVNTYQDEMRVLTTVHEASDTGEGI